MRKLVLLATVAAFAAAPALAQPQPNAGQSAPGRSTQTSPTPQASPQAGPQGGSQASNAARQMSATEFLRQAQMSDRYEIASSRLAQEKAQKDEVKRFAQEMVRDHTRTTQELMDLMQRVRGGAQTSGMTQGTTQGTAQGSAQGTTQGTTQGGSSASGAGTGTAAGAAQGGSQGRAGLTTAQGGVQAEGLDSEHQQMLQRLQSASGTEFDRMYTQQQVQAHQKAVDMFTAYSQQGENAQVKQWAAKTLPTLQQHLQRAQQLQRSL